MRAAGPVIQRYTVSVPPVVEAPFSAIALRQVLGFYLSFMPPGVDTWSRDLTVSVMTDSRVAIFVLECKPESKCQCQSALGHLWAWPWKQLAVPEIWNEQGRDFHRDITSMHGKGSPKISTTALSRSRNCYGAFMRPDSSKCNGNRLLQGTGSSKNTIYNLSKYSIALVTRDATYLEGQTSDIRLMDQWHESQNWYHPLFLTISNRRTTEYCKPLICGGRNGIEGKKGSSQDTEHMLSPNGSAEIS
jgi:hypothetical protein